MAVTLPTITVTDEQADIILSAFKKRFNTTTAAETATAYRRELVHWVRSVVQAVAYADAMAAAATADASLPDPDTVE